MEQKKTNGLVLTWNRGENREIENGNLKTNTTMVLMITSVCRSERLAKYNQLLRIEEELGTNAKFAGENFRKGVWSAASLQM